MKEQNGFRLEVKPAPAEFMLLEPDTLYFERYGADRTELKINKRITATANLRLRIALDKNGSPISAHSMWWCSECGDALYRNRKPDPHACFIPFDELKEQPHG